MVKKENLQLNILEISADTVSFEFVLDGKKTKHEAKIVNNGGIFGVEFPQEVSLKISYFPDEAKDFISRLRIVFFASKELQAA
jgi:hypothetical protein